MAVDTSATRRPHSKNMKDNTHLNSKVRKHSYTEAAAN